MDDGQGRILGGGLSNEEVEMEIKCIKDVEVVAGEMHDSEFEEKDFGFDSEKKIFYLKSHSPEVSGKGFYLEFYNVEKYTPLNLNKIKEGKATGGVFNNIKIRNNGLGLTLISQDLKIILKLSKLEGKFEIKSK